MIVDDHESMRGALRTVIGLESDLVLAAEAKSGQTAIACLAQVRPDVVLMDSSMPEMNGLETTRRLRELQPDLRIIGITLYEETSYLEEMIELGACGYVLKTGSPAEIIKAVRTVAAGGTWFQPSIPRRVRKPGHARKETAELNDEELAVARLLANGRTSKEVAASLGLSASTVAASRNSAMNKLGSRNRAELVRVAKDRGWLDA